MAKLAFSKIRIPQTEVLVKSVSFTARTGEEIQGEIKTYLPFEEKIKLIERIVNLSLDEKGYVNPMKIEMYASLEIIYAYTNLSFTEKMKEDSFKLYDSLRTSGILSIVEQTIKEEQKEIRDFVEYFIKEHYRYKTSALGVLEAISKDYDQTNINVEALISQLKNLDNMDFLKDVVGKLG